MISESSKMLRMIRAYTGRSAADFAEPLSRQRAAVEKAENGKVSEQTTEELIAKALEAYGSEIPEFLAAEAKRSLAASLESFNGDHQGESEEKKFHVVEIRKVNHLEQVVCTGYVMTDCPSKHAFAIIVRDTAMQPEIREGAIAVLNPDMPPSEGVLVGALLTTSGTVVRRYSRVAGIKKKATLLTSPHPNEYPPLSCLKNELRWVHVVHSITVNF
jgi:hypothetical protein